MERYDARPPNDSIQLAVVRWRTGGSAGRTVYAVFGPEHAQARDDDSYLIGMFDTAELAQSAVDGHNAQIEGEADE
jgi:hypothetical protein